MTVKSLFLWKLSSILITVYRLIAASNEFVLAKESGNPAEIAEKFLPESAQLEKPLQPETTGAILRYDFDKDGLEEMVVTYKVAGEPIQPKALLLKKENGQWKKVWEAAGEGVGIDYSALLDITGDGKKEYIVGWMIGASAGNQLEIYQWHGGTLQRIADYAYYHRLDVLKDGIYTSFAIWDRFCCDAFVVNVLSWDGTKLVQNEKMFAQYYPKIKSFMKIKLKLWMLGTIGML